MNAMSSAQGKLLMVGPSSTMPRGRGGSCISLTMHLLSYIKKKDLVTGHLPVGLLF